MTCVIAGVTACLAATAAAAQDRAGHATVEIPVPHRGEPVEGAVFCPMDEDGAPTLFGENLVFEGVPAAEGAKVVPGRAPPCPLRPPPHRAIEA